MRAKISICCPGVRTLFEPLKNPPPDPVESSYRYSVEMVIACMHGQRAWLARGLLALYGYRHMALLEGFVKGWREAGLPMEK